MSKEYPENYELVMAGRKDRGHILMPAIETSMDAHAVARQLKAIAKILETRANYLPPECCPGSDAGANQGQCCEPMEHGECKWCGGKTAKGKECQTSKTKTSTS